MEILYKKVSDYIDSKRDEIIFELTELCKIPSVSKSGEGSFIFGREVYRALSKTAELYSKNGYAMTALQDKGYALCVLEGQGDGIGLFSHADVVPVNDDWVKTTPFAPLEENGVLYGRGVSDDKSAIVESLYALMALRDAGVELKSRITVFVGGSEETGMADIKNFVLNERMPQVSVTADSDFPVSVGEKGIFHLYAVSKKPFCDIKSFKGGSAFNIVLDKAEAKVLINSSEQTVLGKGLPAHAAHPEGSKNAAEDLADKLCALNICESDKEILNSFKTAISGYYGENLKIASEGAFGKLTCANGIVDLTDNGCLKFSLDIRYGNEVSPIELEKTAIESLDILGFDTIIDINDEGFLLDENGEDIKVILDCCRLVSGIKDAQPYKTYGGTYARNLKNAYAISHSSPYSIESLSLPPAHGGAHQSDEALFIKNYLDGIKTLALIIAGLDKNLTK